LDVILKQKYIPDMATQQLLLDTYNMKAIMTQLPQIAHPLGPDGAPSSSSSSNAGAPIKPPSAMYLKLVNSKVAHIEMILKLIGTPQEILLERFRIMWPQGQSSDLQLLMSLKGTKRNDQQVILEMLGLSAAGKILNKTAHNIFAAGSGVTHGLGGGGGGSSSSSSAAGAGGVTSSSGASAGEQQQHSASSAAAGAASASYSAASAAAASAAALASKSMQSLSLDISSSARTAVGQLKWSHTQKS
jgi:hypothetical protein